MQKPIALNKTGTQRLPVAVRLQAESDRSQWPLSTIGYATLDRSRMAEAAGIASLLRTVGAAVGISIATTHGTAAVPAKDALECARGTPAASMD